MVAALRVVLLLVVFDALAVLEAWRDGGWGALGIMYGLMPGGNLVIALGASVFGLARRRRLGPELGAFFGITWGAALVATLAAMFLIGALNRR